MKKFIICSLLIVLALCQDRSSPRTQIQSFIDGIAKSLNITVTDEIPKCFEDSHVDYFFDLLQTTALYTESIRDGKFNGFMVTAVRSWAVGMKIDKSLKCVGESKDFKSIIKALDIDETNHVEICKMTMLFLDTYPGLVTPILGVMSSHIERKSFEEAGIVLGQGLVELNKNEYDEKTMRVTSFINGIFLRNNVPVPDSLRSHCLEKSENDSVIHILRFYRQWSTSLKETKQREVLRETMHYFLEDGLKHYEETGKEVWECIRNSPDNEKLRRITKYNLDPYDSAFDFDFGNFLSCERNVRRYVKIMTNVRNLLEKKTKFYLLAGLNLGTLLTEVSKSGIN
jgi:hypothetical protein